MTVARRELSELEMDDEQWRRSFRRKYWIGVSILGSVIVLVGSFTVPFRQNEPFFVKSAPKALVKSVSRSVAPPVAPITEKSSNQRLLNEIEALEAHFMEQVRAKQQRADNLPTRQEMRQHWRKIEARRQARIRSLAAAQPGSLEAQYRQELVEAAADGPLSAADN